MATNNLNGESSRTGTFLNAFNPRSPTSEDFAPPKLTHNDSIVSHQTITANDSQDLDPALETKDNRRYIVWRVN